MVTRLMTISILVLGLTPESSFALASLSADVLFGILRMPNVRTSGFEQLVSEVAPLLRGCLEFHFTRNLISGVKILDDYRHRKLGFCRNSQQQKPKLTALRAVVIVPGG